jgi:uncharacterized protein (DUF1499 family)
MKSENMMVFNQSVMSNILNLLQFNFHLCVVHRIVSLTIHLALPIFGSSLIETRDNFSYNVTAFGIVGLVDTLTFYLDAHVNIF